MVNDRAEQKRGKMSKKLGMVVCTCDISVQEAEAGGSKFGSHPKGIHCQLVCKKQTGKIKRRACVF